jgi:hypothetical protein
MSSSVCFPRLPVETTEQQVAQLFDDVERVDMVLMEDGQGEFQMAFVHFNNPERMRTFIDHISQHEFYMNDWLVKPNYKPVKRSTRKWTPEELEEIEQYFKEKEMKM